MSDFFASLYPKHASEAFRDTPISVVQDARENLPYILAAMEAGYNPARFASRLSETVTGEKKTRLLRKLKLLRAEPAGTSTSAVLPRKPMPYAKRRSYASRTSRKSSFKKRRVSVPARKRTYAKNPYGKKRMKANVLGSIHRVLLSNIG